MVPCRVQLGLLQVWEVERSSGSIRSRRSIAGAYGRGSFQRRDWGRGWILRKSGAR